MSLKKLKILRFIYFKSPLNNTFCFPRMPKVWRVANTKGQQTKEKCSRIAHTEDQWNWHKRGENVWWLKTITILLAREKGKKGKEGKCQTRTVASDGQGELWEHRENPFIKSKRFHLPYYCKPCIVQISACKFQRTLLTCPRDSTFIKHVPRTLLSCPQDSTFIKHVPRTLLSCPRDSTFLKHVPRTLH